MPRILGIIPARYASSRFPGKALAMIGGMTMIERVYNQCIKSSWLDEVIVATDDHRIFDTIKKAKGKVVMTDASMRNGTERCARAAEDLREDWDYIINIQGDEPFIHPEQIDELAQATVYHQQITTLARKEHDPALALNRDVVKVTFEKEGRALEFFREMEPARDFYKHIGIYGFPAHILQEVVRLKPTARELELHLEQYRWLDNGYPVYVAVTEYDSYSVDRPEDIIALAAIFEF